MKTEYPFFLNQRKIKGGIMVDPTSMTNPLELWAHRRRCWTAAFEANPAKLPEAQYHSRCWIIDISSMFKPASSTEAR